MYQNSGNRNVKVQKCLQDLQLVYVTTSSYCYEYCTIYTKLCPSPVSCINSNMKEYYTICLYFISVSDFKLHLSTDSKHLLVGGSVCYKALIGCKMFITHYLTCLKQNVG